MDCLVVMLHINSLWNQISELGATPSTDNILATTWANSRLDFLEKHAN